ncbi:hypothetical protein [Ectobacillus sp. sgz5001026]|uniref:hypothetical protein n=1 Tax=Ectobacillus sp. sgz5001026 TaxID=3242473 RepID=UPI0036D43071
MKTNNSSLSNLRNRKQRLVPFCFAFLLLFLVQSIAYAESNKQVVCPKAEELSANAEQDKEEVEKALQDYIVKNMYGNNKKWTAEVVSPLQNLKRTDASYYHIAVQQCGLTVANRSYFVRLRFPNSSQMNKLGEFFISKDSRKKWTVWFRYV